MLNIIIDFRSSQIIRWCQTLIHQLLVELVSKSMEYKLYLLITLFKLNSHNIFKFGNLNKKILKNADNRLIFV